MDQIVDQVLGKEFLKLSVQDNICCVCVCEKRKRKNKNVDSVDNFENKSAKIKLKKMLFCCYKVENDHTTESIEEYRKE